MREKGFNSKNVVKTKPTSYSKYIFKQKMTPYIFILPNLLIFLTFSIIPIVMGIFYSFTKWNGLNDPKFVGLDNYIKLISDKSFHAILFNTFTFAVVTITLIFLISLGLAYLMILPIKAKGLFRVSFYWPVMISAIIVGVIWQWLFDDTIGLLNGVLYTFGYPSVKILSDPFNAKLIVILAMVWSKAGYYMVMFIGGLQSIPTVLYEAAEIDGASKWQQFYKITLPLLKPTILMVFILVSVTVLREYPLVYALTNGGPFNATKFAVQYIYDMAFEKRMFGYASSMSIFMMIIIFIFTKASFKLTKGGEY